VAITTDAGFLGGLNMKVVSAALDEARSMPTTMIIVGERGKACARGVDLPMVAFPGVKDEERHGQAAQLRDYIFQKALSGDLDTVKVVYPQTVSFGVHRIRVVPFLPFKPENIKRPSPRVKRDLILESRPENIIEYLVYLWMGVRLYDIFGFSRLAEFSARYVHLEESTEKLKEEEGKIRQEYFRVRHELADRALRELISGRSVRGKK
jgi:F0F1-type ATP synthase gamma subunit